MEGLVREAPKQLKDKMKVYSATLDSSENQVPATPPGFFQAFCVLNNAPVTAIRVSFLAKGNVAKANIAASVPYNPDLMTSVQPWLDLLELDGSS